ncbi:hypothetical protein OG912_32320 [Streptomyces sp. NBC_00464]|uniref:hypothetical protein n=1 Tax=Streptomyces sp. NBC_00464 TaxID=2975751 RepID=UPI002E16D804
MSEQCACDGQTLLEVHASEACYDRSDVPRCGLGPTLEELEEEYERDRQARIDRYYQGESAADMAERVVDLEDELGGETEEGLLTGMHADVAEAQAEIARLNALVDRARTKTESVERAYDEVVRALNASVAGAEQLGKELKDARADSAYFEEWATGNGHRLNAALADVQRLERALRLSEAKIGGAARYVDQANARSDMLEGAMTAYEGIADERDRYRLAWTSARLRARRQAETFRGWRGSIYEVARSSFRAASEYRRSAHRYRLAWLSARRRAADEANFGMEAMELRDAEIVRLKVELADLRAALHGA